jgi:protein O-GlcNAc transferase
MSRYAPSIQRFFKRFASASSARAVDRSLAQELLDLGIAAEGSGRIAEALQRYRMAIDADPQFARAHMYLGITLHAEGDLAAAIASHQRALALDPGDAAVHYNLALVHLDAGEAARAEAAFRSALRLRVSFPEAWVGLADALEAIGNNEEALTALDTAIGQREHYIGALLNSSVLLQKMGRFGRAQERLGEIDVAALCAADRHAEAESFARQMIQDWPGDSFGLKALCTVLAAQERYEEALPVLRRLVTLLPADPETHNNLGIALQALGQSSEAEMNFRFALEIKPDYYQAHNELGVALQAQDRLYEAEASFRRALDLEPNFHLAHSNLGYVLRHAGRPTEAVASYRSSLDLKPDYHEAHSNLIFTLDFQDGCDLREHQAERDRWYAQHGLRYAASIEAHANVPDPERRLRIGYVSADFRRHSACSVFAPILQCHDRAAFEVVCYSGVRREDDITQSLRGAVDEWHSTLRMSDEALAEQIRGDRIDLLVDLSGHTEGNRLLVFARKPAPVQVTAWGHATGTGVRTIDYLFSDPVLVPQQERGLFAEEVIDLSCSLCYAPPQYLPGVSGLPALGGSPFTFGCINRVEKISDRTIAAWGRILGALPQSRLLLKHVGLGDPGVRERLLGRLGAVGIGAERVRLIGFTPHAEHLKVYHEVDLGLDPFPQNGGVSTAEALWMGVPVVALNGTTISGRIAASMLTALDMREWIAGSDEEYVRIALEAARDLPGLARTRGLLRPRLAASVFGDEKRYTREVEAAYRTMWQRWCAGNTGDVPSKASR